VNPECPPTMYYGTPGRFFSPIHVLYIKPLCLSNTVTDHELNNEEWEACSADTTT